MLIAAGPYGKLYGFCFQATACRNVLGRIRKSGAIVKILQNAIGKPGYYTVLYLRETKENHDEM